MGVEHTIHSCEVPILGIKASLAFPYHHLDCLTSKGGGWNLVPGFLSQGREVMLQSRCVIIKYVQEIIYIEAFCAFLFAFIRSLL